MGEFGIRWEMGRAGRFGRGLQLAMRAALRSLCTLCTLVGARGFYPSTWFVFK